jgi:tetratricopeptide (TPR) repeat protein
MKGIRICVITALLALAFAPKPSFAAAAAQMCYQDTDLSADVTDCTEAINQNPKDELSYSNRCLGYFGLSNYSAAVADCTQAIALNPKDETAYLNRCGSYNELGNYNAGLADCRCSCPGRHRKSSASRVTADGQVLPSRQR